jgi:uncharacterized protein involved in outer membrane biogenesis
MRKLLYGIAGLVALLIVAAVIGPSLVDWNGYKGEIAEQAKAATGRDLKIGGNISLGLLPSPHLSAADVRVSNLPGAATPDMVRIGEIEVEVHLIPLFSGRVEVAAVRLANPVIELERLADGRVNWTFGKPETGAPVPAAAAQPQGQGRADTQSFRLDSLRIENGTLIYRDRGQVVERIERLTAELAAESLAGPFRVKGGLTARGMPLTVDASVGEMAGAAPAPVRLALGSSENGAQLVLSGIVADAKNGPRYQGKIQAKVDDLHRLGSAPSGARGANAAEPLPFDLQGQVDADATAVSIKDIDARVGDATATGVALARLGAKTEAEVALKVGRINLDKLLAERPQGVVAPAGGAPGASGRPAPPPAPAAKSDDAFAIPPDIRASVDIAVDAVTYKGGTIRETRLVALADKGEIELTRVGAVLPGGGRVGLTGRVKAVDGKPNFQGGVDAAADNLRVLVGWLGGNVDDIPPHRLRTLRLAAKVDGDPTQVQVKDLDVALDSSRVTGGVTYALRARPAFGASIVIDQLNADAYMPAAPAKPAAQPATPAPTGPAAATPASDKGGLAALTEFDANVAFRVGALTYRQTVVQGIVFDATLFNGALTIRDARVRNVAGTSLGLKGEVAGLAGLPTFKGTIEGESRDLTGLLRLAGAAPGGSGKPIGPAKLSGQADAAQDRVKLDARLELAGMAATLDASVSGLNAAPRVEVALNASHPELAQFVSAVGLAGSPLRGRGQLNAKVRGSMDAVDFETKLNASGADFSLNGKIAEPMGRAATEATLALAHPDFAQFMRVLDPQYQTGEARPGALDVKATVKGDKQNYAIGGVRVAVGQMALSGEAVVALAGVRPKLVANLDGGHLDLNLILPPSKAAPRTTSATSAGVPGPSAGGPSSGSPFTRDPIDFSALGEADADVKFASRSLTYRNFRVEEPRVALTLADRVLKLNEMVGRLFDGGIDVKAEVDGRATPKVQAAIKIDRANVGKALFEAADVDLAKGTLAFDLSVAGTGRSSQDIASSLDGTGKLSVVNGSIKGFNLRAASDRLKNVDRPADLLGLLQPAMGGGETQFSSLAGTYKIEKGVLRTDETKLTADAGAGDVKGTVDLGRWHMDMMGWFRLTEHPNSPPFGMRMVGPPDNAQRIFDTNDLQRFLVSRGVGTLLRKVLPQQQQPQAPAASQPPQQQQQQQKAKPEDILKGLLQGLGRPRQQ